MAVIKQIYFSQMPFGQYNKLQIQSQILTEK